MSQANPSDEEIDVYAQAWLGNGNKQSDAWREAYPKSACSDAVMYIKASNMHKMAKVQVRIAHYKAETVRICADKHGVTIDSLIAELEEARAMGMENSQASACVSATMAKAKLSGLDVQKVDHTSSDGSMSPKDSGAAVLDALSRKYVNKADS